MASAALDTLEIAKRLKNAGFNEAQAEVMTGVLRDARDADMSQLATKDDLARFEAATRVDFDRLEAATKTEVGRFEAATRVDFDRLEAMIKTEVGRLEAMIKTEVGRLEAAIIAQGAGVRTEMEILRRDLTIRLGSMIVVATGLLLAAKFFG